MVPAAVTAKPRAVAVVLVVEAQAQSIAPVAPAAKATFLTLGEKVKVMPAATVGKPATASAPDFTVITPVAVSIAIGAVVSNILLLFSEAERALYSVAAAVTPGKPSVWKASLISDLGEEAAIIISDTLARTV